MKTPATSPLKILIAKESIELTLVFRHYLFMSLKISAHVILVLSLNLVLGGCATLMSGTEQELTIQSNVEGAQIFFGESLVGETPAKIRIPRRINRALTLKKPGYAETKLWLPTQMESNFWINIPLTLVVVGSFGITTDLVDNAAWKYAPDAYFVNMKSEGQSYEDYLKEIKRNQFLVINQFRLQKDIPRRSGESLETLLFLQR